MLPKCDRCGQLLVGKWYRLVALDQKPAVRDGCKLAEMDYRKDYIVCPSCMDLFTEMLESGESE